MRNLVLKKLSVFALTVVMAVGGPSLSAFAEDATDSGADALLEEFRGTYTALFPAFRDDRYDAMWEKSLSEYAGVDAENAETVKDAFLSVYESDIHGEEAQKKAEGEPGWFMFDCSFAGGVEYMTFDGNTISGVDKDGNEIFNNTYKYFDSLKKDFDPMTEMYMEGVPEEDWPLLHIYVSDGPDDEFKYFAFADDTPAETYHLEFRYGSDPEDLCKYFSGPYGYWMVSATYKDCDDKMMENCIDLFVEENADSVKAIAESFSGNGEEAGDTAAGAMPESDGEEVEEVIEIATAEELAAINENLSGHYVLTADIDLGGEEWTPIGAYAPSGDSPEEQEIPSDEHAFTGTFDGRGHTISNLSVHQPEGWSLGLFGCIANTKIGNFTLENAQVEGTVMVSCVVGYAYNSEVKDVQLASGKVNVNYTEMSSEGMYGGIVGAGMASRIADCEAQSEINLPDGAANAGIIGGGLEMTSVVNCTSTGSITAGDNCYGLGAISGCGFGSEEFTDCYAHDAVIKAGEGSTWIGKITGYAGGFEDESAGIPVTVFTGCTAENVTIEAPEGTEGVGDIVGAGFYSEEAAEAYGAPYDKPTVFVIAEEEQANAA